MFRNNHNNFIRRMPHPEDGGHCISPSTLLATKTGERIKKVVRTKNLRLYSGKGRDLKQVPRDMQSTSFPLTQTGHMLIL
jgi:hypothetical protein